MIKLYVDEGHSVLNSRGFRTGTKYLLSGFVLSEHKAIITEIITEVSRQGKLPYWWLTRQKEFDFFFGDNGYIHVARKAVDMFKKMTINNHETRYKRIDFYLKKYNDGTCGGGSDGMRTYNWDVYHKEAHHLSGIQLYRFFIGCHTNSWK